MVLELLYLVRLITFSAQMFMQSQRTRWHENPRGAMHGRAATVREWIRYRIKTGCFYVRDAEGSTTKHRGQDFTVGCVRFSTKSKNAHTPPEWGCEGTQVPSQPPGATALRILHDILWCYHAEMHRGKQDNLCSSVTRHSSLVTDIMGYAVWVVLSNHPTEAVPPLSLPHH